MTIVKQVERYAREREAFLPPRHSNSWLLDVDQAGGKVCKGGSILTTKTLVILVVSYADWW